MESVPNFFAACRFIDQGSVRREDEKGVKRWMAALALGCCSLLAEQVLYQISERLTLGVVFKSQAM